MDLTFENDLAFQPGEIRVAADKVVELIGIVERGTW
jgi:hypothetical protein